MKNLDVHRPVPGSQSPWTRKMRLSLLLWEFCWAVFCAWTPKPANPWRLMWLRRFGATIHGTPFVHQRARVQIPWNLTLHDRACMGDGANAYSLGEIEIHSGAVVAQEAYLCTGTHALDTLDLPLLTGKITVGANAFIGARAFILPCVTIGEGAVVGAGSLVSRSVEPWTIVGGNPAKFLRHREISA